MTCWVVDASVLLKWFLPAGSEPHHDRADALREAHVAELHQLCVPTLAIYELGNTLARLKSTADAQADLEDFALLDLRVEPMTSARSRRAVDFVQRFGATFHEASYHALAVDLDATLVTVDARYLDKAASAGHIQLLSAWKPH